MLFLQLKDKEYLTIGDDIVIQVFTNSAVRVSVQAPRELTVLRGEVLERNGSQRPQAVFDKSPEQAKKAQKRQKTTPNSVSNG
ncbi:MAG: carbon storage regulator [Oscillospiraceae bacterium]|nr:carbon storage regulator [Oscillospiraceae bacterium]